jgi:hypothetical protein
MTLSPGHNFCPNGSKVGTATIKTPLLPVTQPLTGSVYLAAQESNPFDSVFAMYIVAEDPVSGSLVKLAGHVYLCTSVGEEIAGLPCQAPGQIITTFENSPQVPFEDAEVDFFGGERAPLSTPAYCGTYTTTAAFVPWSAAPGEPPVIVTGKFNIETGPKTLSQPDGSASPDAPLPFSPTLTGGATNVIAGAFSPFTATFSRSTGEQNMQSIEVQLPPGLSGILANVELCPEPQANLGECGPNSLIGETTVSVGVGGEPYTDSGGKFYLTGPYNGTTSSKVGTSGCAPFGITFEVPAEAGPFDLANTKDDHPPCDCVLVRGKIAVHPLHHRGGHDRLQPRRGWGGGKSIIGRDSHVDRRDSTGNTARQRPDHPQRLPVQPDELLEDGRHRRDPLQRRRDGYDRCAVPGHRLRSAEVHPEVLCQYLCPYL